MLHRVVGIVPNDINLGKDVAGITLEWELPVLGLLYEGDPTHGVLIKPGAAVFQKVAHEIAHTFDIHFPKDEYKKNPLWGNLASDGWCLNLDTTNCKYFERDTGARVNIDKSNANDRLEIDDVESVQNLVINEEGAEEIFRHETLRSFCMMGEDVNSRTWVDLDDYKVLYYKFVSVK